MTSNEIKRKKYIEIKLTIYTLTLIKLMNLDNKS